MIYRNYNSLSNEDKELYIEISALIEAYKREWNILAPIERVGRVYKAILDDSPKYFWLKPGYEGIEKTKNGVKSYVFMPAFRYDYDAKTIDKMRACYDKTVSKIISAAKRKHLSLYDQILFLHDYLVDNTDYDINAKHAYDAYGCLVFNRAVCSGYSKAFQTLMHELGVECGLVTGNSKINMMHGSSHMWNYIKLSDGYYFVDVTWDDPIFENGKTGGLSHNYFCLNYNEMQLTHGFDNNQFIPLEYGQKFDYYKYKGWFLNDYSFPLVKSIATKQLSSSNTFFVKFGSRYETEKAKRDLVDFQKAFSIPGISNRILYNTSKSGLILSIETKK